MTKYSKYDLGSYPFASIGSLISVELSGSATIVLT